MGEVSHNRVRPLSVVLAVFGVLLLTVGIIYLTVKAPDLPGFIPGKPGYRPKVARKFTKRGLLAIVLAVLALVGAWYSTRAGGSSSTSREP